MILRFFRIVALCLLLLALGAPPAVAWSEGTYASADGASTVTLRRTREGGVELSVTSPLVGGRLDTALAPAGESGVLREPAEEASWFGRLMGSEPEGLPFDGDRLVFARTEDEALVVSTLEVDDEGRPTYRRLALEPSGDGLRLTVRLFGTAGLEALGPVELARSGR